MYSLFLNANKVINLLYQTIESLRKLTKLDNALQSAIYLKGNERVALQNV